MNRILVAIGFAVAYLIAFEFSYQYNPTALNRSAFLWLGLILGAFCLITFISSGSRQIIFAPVLSYGHLVLVAAPAIYIGIGDGHLRSYLRPSSALLFMSLIFIVQIGLFVSSPSAAKSVSREFSVDGSLQNLAMTLLVIAFVANRMGGLATAFETVALAAVVLSSLVTFTRPTIGRVALHGLCLLLIVAVFFLYQFDGFGRLEIASYFLSIGVIFSWIYNSYLPKAVTLVATMPAYFLLTMKRVDTVEQRYGIRVSENDTLDSVFGPFQSGAYILQQAMTGEISPTHGQSWLTTLLFWVPKTVWPEKAPGFGRAIVSLTQPHNVQVPHHSDAAPYLAEFVWDFGMLGLLLIPVLVWLISRTDRWIINDLLTVDRRQGRRNPALLAASLAAVAGMLINFGWGASFTFVSRTAIPALLLFGLYLLSAKWETAPVSCSETDDNGILRSPYLNETIVAPNRLPSRWHGGVNRLGFHTRSESRN